MSAPVLWIVLPAFLGGALLLMLAWPRAVNAIATGAAFLLAWAALLLPIDQSLVLGSLNFKITETFFVLGRSISLTAAEQPLLMAVWGIAFLWLAGAWFARPPALFAPIALLAVALLTAALRVEPFLYAALLFELVALLFLPLLAPPGRPSRRSALRFLSFITLGMPFILFVGWLLAGVVASPGTLVLVVRAGTLLGVGFAFLLAIVPFHSWVPQLMEEANPYAAGFLLFILPGSVLLFGLELIDRFVWLRESATLVVLLQGVGGLMAVVGGLFAALEKHIGRMLGYAVLLETGLSLLAISSGQPVALPLFFGLLLPRAISLLVWAGTLSNWQVGAGATLTLTGLQGLARPYPLRSAGLLLAMFSLAGLPLLAGFPFRIQLVQALAVAYPLSAAAVLLGSLGLLAAGLRTLTALVSDPPTGTSEPLEAATILQLRQDFGASLFLAVTALGSLLVGLFPHWFWPFLTSLTDLFNQLGR